MRPAAVCFLSLFLFGTGRAWDSEDLEVFDVVEEVGENFYDLLDVPRDAPASDIRKAFRALSLKLHPDKNKEPDAEIKFRRLAAVNEILRDPVKRSKYNDVLDNGLPDWKQAVYYYRRVRKMGLMELAIILFIIITIGQYLVAWASYFEKKYALEEFLNARSKQLQKKQKKGKIDMETLNSLPQIVNALQKPTCTLPVQICRLAWFLVFESPFVLKKWWTDYLEERKRRKEEEENREESSEEERIVVPRERGPRRRKGFPVPEIKDDNSPGQTNETPFIEFVKEPEVPPIVAGGLWTDDDLLELIRLVKKFPTGTKERWEKIGDAMRRPANEVAHMAHKIKDEGFKPLSKHEEEENIVKEIPKKVKTKGGNKLGEEVEEGTWTQSQQKAFEAALVNYPKGSSSDRWEKIAKSVPGKTKEECMMRYKYVAESLRKKKEKENSSTAVSS